MSRTELKDALRHKLKAGHTIYISNQRQWKAQQILEGWTKAGKVSRREFGGPDEQDSSGWAYEWIPKADRAKVD